MSRNAVGDTGSSRSRQPPIWLIERFGRMKLTWLIWWPAHLVPTARSISAATASSSASERSSARRSNSRLANRHVRNWPSAVSRTRSQSPQNGFVTRRDHADDARSVEVAPAVGGRRTTRRHLLERVHRVDPADDLVLADDLVPAPAAVRVERHELDEPHLDA